MAQNEHTKTKEQDKSAVADSVPPTGNNTEKQTGVATRRVVFQNSYEILVDSPLEAQNVGHNKAYRVEAVGRARQNLFAVVCERHYVPRRFSADKYSNMEHPSIIELVAYGPVYWPVDRQEHYVFIYREDFGARLLLDSDRQAMGLKQDVAMDFAVKPLVSVLELFDSQGFVHGAIRPNNMFKTPGGVKPEAVILGDCLSMQASYAQPVLYETVARGQADPVARGLGILSDDIYAFGVSLAVMMRSSDPLENQDNDGIIRQKINLGSYQAITGKDRFKGTILELLRGVLHDDQEQRWTLEDIHAWLDGQRLAPRQAIKVKKAARPFSFNGKKYFNTSLLAMALETSPQETVRIIEDSTLEQWLTRSLDDSDTVERVEEAYRETTKMGQGAGYEDRLVANVSLALDKRGGPIRFRGLRLNGRGIGTALHEAVVLDHDIKVFADLFLQSVAMNWVTSINPSEVQVSDLIHKFDLCRSALRQSKRLGYGIERCLYLLAPEAPCLSQRLQNYYVETPEDILTSFEDLCGKDEAPSSFLDRHSIAFLSVHFPGVIDPYLFELGSAEVHMNVLGTLKCFSYIQQTSKLPPFPNICRVFNKRLSVLYARYHDRKTRESMEDKAEALVKAGDLVGLAQLLDNSDTSRRDFQAFLGKMREYAALRTEYNVLEAGLADERNFGKETGQQYAAIIACLLGLVAAICVFFFYFSGDSSF